MSAAPDRATGLQAVATMTTRSRARSTVHAVAVVLLAIVLLRLAIVLLRLALDLVLLVCRAVAWLLLRLCWLLEAGVDHLREPRKTAIVEIPPKRARARVQPRAENTSISAYASPDAMDPADVELAQLVARVVGRRAPATRALTERMLRDATPMEVN